MSLTDLTTVDLILRLPGGGNRVALVIVDGGEIADAKERESALHAKLAAYLEFVASGQFARESPDLSGAELSVEIVCHVAPTEGMKEIEGVRHRVRPDIYLPVTFTAAADFMARLAAMKGK